MLSRNTALALVLFLGATAFAAGVSVEVLSSHNGFVVVQVTGAPAGSLVEAVVVDDRDRESVVDAACIDPATGVADVNFPMRGQAYKLVVRCPAGAVLCTTYDDPFLID